MTENYTLYQRIKFREEEPLSQWVTLVKNTVHSGDKSLGVFHSLKLADYVSVFAITEDHKIPLVRQFRPALNRITLEFPAGLLEIGDEPETRAHIELFEETGFRADPKFFHLLGKMAPDTGRLENTLWGYLATGVVLDHKNWIPEPGVDLVLLDKPEFKMALLNGEFDHALHVALLGLALTKGLFSFD